MTRAVRALLLVTLLAAATPAWAQASCPAPGGGESELEAAANSLAAGEYCELDTTGLVGNDLRPDTGYDSMLVWTTTGVWDPVGLEMRWVGRQAGSGMSARPMRHLVYSEASNTWARADVGTFGMTGHGYDHNAVVPSTGRSYFRDWGYPGNIYYYTDGDALDSWTYVTNLSGQACCSGLAWFPDLDLGGGETGGLILADDTGGVQAYIDGGWTELAGSGLGYGILHAIAEYNPVYGVVVFGGGTFTGGSSSSNDLFTVASDGTVAALDSTCPTAIGAASGDEGPLVVDPASGDLLVYDKSALTWREYDWDAGTWSVASAVPAMTVSNNATRAIVTPVSTYNVLMIVQDEGGGSTPATVWIYRHTTPIPIGTPTVGPTLMDYGPQGTVDTYVNESCTDTGSIYLSLITDTDADCKWSSTPPQAFADMTDFDTDGGYCEDSDGADTPAQSSDEDWQYCTSDSDCAGSCRRYVHWHELTGLAEASYTYYVMCDDGTENDKALAVPFTYDESSSDYDDRVSTLGTSATLCLTFDYERTVLDPAFENYILPDEKEYDASTNDQRCENEDCEQVVFSANLTGSQGALRFEYPTSPNTDSTKGYFEHNFTPDSLTCLGATPACPQAYPDQFGDGTEFWVQFRYKVADPHMYSTGGGESSAKLIIVGEGDTSSNRANSCSTSEAVLITEEFGGPHAYHSCGQASNHNSFGLDGNSFITQADATCCTKVTNADAIPAGCSAGGGITSGVGTAAHKADSCIDANHGGGTFDQSCAGCPQFGADTWITMTQRLLIGTMQTISDHTTDAGSRWQVWLTPDGGSRTVVFDSSDSAYNHGGWHWHTDSGTEFGKLWLLPQVSSKDSSETHSQKFFYYDDVIVSSADPGEPGAPPPVCGDGTLDIGEQCDPGGADPLDCCADPGDEDGTDECQYMPLDEVCSDDGSVCTDDQCDATGTCLHPDNSADCTAADGLYCNGTDTCSGGTCSVHSGDPCTGADGDADCAETCDEVADDCLGDDPNGSACASGLFCFDVLYQMGSETCQTGSCDAVQGTTCDDSDVCTDDACDDVTDQCDHIFNAANDASCLTGSKCSGTFSVGP